jgi:hypothetical protein
MVNIKELYKKNVYGVMGTLIFHILIVTIFWIAELDFKVKTEKEEAILLDFVSPKEKIDVAQQEKTPKNNTTSSDQKDQSYQNLGSNRAVNDALKKDKFFDESYKHDIEEAKKMVADVNNQLSKKVPQNKKFEMPEAITEGQNPDSIKNTIYSGKSNIHYFLENRFHVRLPIPVFLAKGGGLISVDIQVDRTGKVIKAEARQTNNITDPMLPIYATQAAERTIFNSDSKAPSIQKGTITYRFVAQ